MNALLEKLKRYVERFNEQDEECYKQLIPNAQALEWLSANIPLLDCPDQTIEEVYYYRWWTFRKHWMLTADGHLLSEFLPKVAWAGPHNTINCACCHHIREGRWLRDNDQWLKEYIRFWLSEKGDALSYSMWIASAIEDYCSLHDDAAFAAECLDALVLLYEKREARSMRPCGLLWSNDNRDGMEYSISGPGFRPTLNSYMYGDAMAISRMAILTGQGALGRRYAQKAQALQNKFEQLLWDEDFYRTLPCAVAENMEADVRPTVPNKHRVRELVGYIPWYFGLPSPGHEAVFAQLTDPQAFSAPWGLTTAEQRHPRFMFHHEHECLWNGPVWPFATSQTLTAAARVLREYPSSPQFTAADYFALLKQYAYAHRIQNADGTWKLWIDEDMNPYTGEWIARSELKADHWNAQRGGYERGKDYNHSTFADLILAGLLGIHMEKDGVLSAKPMIPESWPYFQVCNLHCAHANWTVRFDRDGSHYHKGVGLQIIREPLSGCAPSTSA